MFLSLKTLYRKRTVIWPFTTQLYGLYQKEKDKINKILFNHQYKRNIVIRKAESIHSPITFGMENILF